MPASRRARVFLLVTAALVISSGHARANPSDPLRDEIAELAKSVKDVLDEEKQSAVAVGDFTGPPRLDSQFGPGIATALADELTRAGVTVSKKADLTLTGNYSDADEKLGGGDTQLVIKINARILARNGDELVKLSQKLPSRKITDNATVAKVTGATVALPPAGSKPDRNEKIREALKEPSVFVDGTKVSAKKGANLAVEVLVRPRPGAAPEARKPKVEDGQAVVALERDEVYELRLHNAHACEGAVTVSIDGLDVFQFSKDRDPKTGRPKFTHFILAGQKETAIAGWHVTNDPHAKENVFAFRVTAYGKGAVSQVNAPRGKVGVITVTYALAASKKEDLPNDDGARSAGGNETGFGPGQKADLKEVSRVIGVVREVVSIRYSH